MKTTCLPARLVLGMAGLTTVLLLGACATAKPGERLLGDWQTDLHGFPILLSISASTLQVQGQEPVAYTLEGDVLKLASDDQTLIRLQFPSRTEMLQTNLTTGEVQRFARRTPVSAAPGAPAADATTPPK